MAAEETERGTETSNRKKRQRTYWSRGYVIAEVRLNGPYLARKREVKVRAHQIKTEEIEGTSPHTVNQEDLFRLFLYASSRDQGSSSPYLVRLFQGVSLLFFQKG